MILCGVCKSFHMRYIQCMILIKCMSICFYNILSSWPSSSVSSDPVSSGQTGHRGFIRQCWGQCDFTLLPWQPSGDALLLVSTNLRRLAQAPVFYLQVWWAIQSLLGGEGQSFLCAKAGRNESFAHLRRPVLRFSYILLWKLTLQHNGICTGGLSECQRYCSFIFYFFFDLRWNRGC